MASTSVAADEMVECPYNRLHRMLRKNLQSHLVKCRLSHPNSNLQQCPFNTSHLIPKENLTEHVINCPDKALLTDFMYSAIPHKDDDEPRKQDVVECDENWDDIDVEDYDPKKYATTAPIVRAHIGDLPSKRREFRKNERKRLGDYDSDDEDQKPKKKYKNGSTGRQAPPPRVYSSVYSSKYSREGYYPEYAASSSSSYDYYYSGYYPATATPADKYYQYYYGYGYGYPPAGCAPRDYYYGGYPPLPREPHPDRSRSYKEDYRPPPPPPQESTVKKSRSYRDDYPPGTEPPRHSRELTPEDDEDLGIYKKDASPVYVKSEPDF